MAQTRVRRYPGGSKSGPKLRQKPGPKPGSPGARAIAEANRARLGEAALSAHMRELGRRGGTVTRERYGETEYYHLVCTLAAHTRWAKAREAAAAAEASEEGETGHATTTGATGGGDADTGTGDLASAPGV